MSKSKSKKDTKKKLSAKKKLKKFREAKKEKKQNVDSKSDKEISGGFKLSIPSRKGKTKLTDRQVDLIYFMTTVISLLGIIFGKEVILKLFELLIMNIF